MAHLRRNGLPTFFTSEIRRLQNSHRAQRNIGTGEGGSYDPRHFLEIKVSHLCYIASMPYEVEVSDEFKDWYEPLSEAEQNSIYRIVMMLEEAGPALAFPYSSGIQKSKFSHMRELRIQHEGRPYRVLYAFDPARSALLILGGDKTSDDRWYDTMVPRADAIYTEHLTALQEEQKKASKKKRPR